MRELLSHFLLSLIYRRTSHGPRQENPSKA